MDMTGNMYWRADWKVCAEYQPGDVVSRAGDLYLALEQNAGLDPADPLNTKYWRLMTAETLPPILQHNDLEGKQGGDEAAGEFHHLAKNEQEAAANATEPGATNPFLTEKDMPYLEKRVTDWTLAAMPEGVGALYDVVWDGVSRSFVAVGDSVAAISPDGKTWEKVECPAGNWRGLCTSSTTVRGRGIAVPGGAGDTISAVGLDGAAMYTTDGGRTWSASLAPAGDWNAAAFGNGVFVAVGEGRTMFSADGQTAWTAHTAPTGYGEDVFFGNGLFYAVGPAGVMTSADGADWTPQETPEATWRCGDYADDARPSALVLGGKSAQNEDDGITWTAGELPSGGWDALKAGGGFFVAVGNSAQCIVSPTKALAWVQKPVPNFLWRGLAFGLDTFVAVGSGIMYARVVDVAAALNGANAPSASNVFATMADLAEILDLLKWKGVI